jgi:hypothetical protein
MVEKTAAFRQRRAADTARWREPPSRGGSYVEVIPSACDSRRPKLRLQSSFGRSCHLSHDLPIPTIRDEFGSEAGEKQDKPIHVVLAVVPNPNAI